MIGGNLIGAPYAWPSAPPLTFDCWSLVVWVRELLDLESPVDGGADAYEPETLGDAIRAERGRWRQVPPGGTLDDGDVCLLGDRHCGVLVDGQVMHACPEAGVVRVSRRATIERSHNIVTWWRWP